VNFVPIETTSYVGVVLVPGSTLPGADVSFLVEILLLGVLLELLWFVELVGDV